MKSPARGSARRTGRAPRGGGQAAYVLPHNPAEVDRLDIQHYVIREVMGTNHLAPIERPAAVLDVGCGPGQWAYDLSVEFPQALVVGIDLVPSKPARPPNFRFVRSNVLHGLPFRSDRFDFVHQRFLITGIPVRSFGTLVGELARVARPGGWIQLVESDTRHWLSPIGPATARLHEMGGRLARAVGLDTTGIVYGSLRRYLRESGVEDVETPPVRLPVGRWGGPLGELIATDFRAVFARLGETCEKRFGIPPEEVHELRSRAQEEYERLRTSWTFTVFWGRKRARPG
jgi:ubiquinone/menaquinone biosynthesis C-methylase UbiE